MQTKNIHTIKIDWKKMLKETGAAKYNVQATKEIKTNLKA